MIQEKKLPDYEFYVDDLLLISADPFNKKIGILIHSTTMWYWDNLWRARERLVIGTIRDGLFLNVEHLTKKSV